MRQAEKEKKKFTSEFRSNSTRVRKFRKKIAKKLKKLKKPLSDITFYQDGMRQAEKEKKKKIYIRIPFMLDRGKKIPKKIAKKLKKLKNLFQTLFLAETG